MFGLFLMFCKNIISVSDSDILLKLCWDLLNMNMNCRLNGFKWSTFSFSQDVLIYVTESDQSCNFPQW